MCDCMCMTCLCVKLNWEVEWYLSEFEGQDSVMREWVSVTVCVLVCVCILRICVFVSVLVSLYV